jgi:hypothetical protein
MRTRAAPAACAGVITEIDVVLLTLTVAEVPPNVTAEGLARLVPVISTVMPPVGGPEVGLMLVIIGADSIDRDNRVLSSKKKNCSHKCKWAHCSLFKPSRSELQEVGFLKDIMRLGECVTRRHMRPADLPSLVHWGPGYGETETQPPGP